MHVKVLVDADSVAREAAAMIAAEARAAVAERGRFVAAVSGGHTPWVMLRALAGEKVPWESVHVVQVDERVGLGSGRQPTRLARPSPLDGPVSSALKREMALRPNSNWLSLEALPLT